MEKRIINAIMHAACLLALLYACYLFLVDGEPYDSTDFVKFAPAAILFGATVVINLAWDLFIGNGIAWLSQMDPLTAAFLLLAAVLMLIAVFIEDDRFAQIFEWAFALATFVAGYEAGRLRQRLANRNNSAATETTGVER